MDHLLSKEKLQKVKLKILLKNDEKILFSFEWTFRKKEEAQGDH